MVDRMRDQHASNFAASPPLPAYEWRARAGYRCEQCGYGVATPAPPRACPMCQAERWSLARRGVAEALGVRRIGGSTFLLTPPTVLDAEASMLLVEAIAALAATRPRVVVDLTGVDVGDPSTAAVLLLRLEALAHGSGGRLRVVRADADAGGIDIHRLKPTDGDAADVIDRDLGHALEAATRLAAG
jgi:uncharacterized OB-fold protein